MIFDINDAVVSQAITKKNHINVLFFGALAEHIAMNAIELPLTQSTQISELKQQLAAMFTGWDQFNQPIHQAVNREMANEKTIVTIGDEVAFFPPVTGG